MPEARRDRRVPIIPTLALVVAATIPLGSLAASAAVGDDFPDFAYSGEVTDKSSLAYNPTGEFIFPSIFHASEYLADPLAEWYLYYAPHESPGGISLMYADSLDGPWTAYAANPLIPNVWSPYYSVNHASSADVMWNDVDGKVYAYFHGDNTVTRWASSTDGVTFTYGGIAVSNAMGGPDVTESSYARIFEHPDPDSPYRFGMFYMANYTDNQRKIRTAESVDGKTWVVRPEPIVSPGSLDGGNVSSADLWEWNGQLYVIYHASTKKSFARPIDKTLTTVGDPVLLHKASGVGADVGRVASPTIVTDRGTSYLFYESGDRLNATISSATAATGNACTAASDEFGGTALDRAVWPTIVREALTRHDVRLGSLVLPTYYGGIASAPLIQQAVPSGDWQVTSEVSITPTEKHQQAGILLYADDDDYAKVVLSYTSLATRVEFIWRSNGTDRNQAGFDSLPASSALGSTIWLRLNSTGGVVSAQISYDGVSFSTLGRTVTTAQLPATQIGPFALKGTTTASEIEATFNWFRWDARTGCVS